MKKPILKIGFTNYSDAELEDKADTILDMITGNGFYPTPTPPLSDLTVARDNFSYIKTQRGRISNYRAIKRVRRNELIGVLRSIGLYVRSETPDDLVRWLTTGYDVQTFEGDVQIPEVPVITQVKDGIYPGTMEITYAASKYALWYEGQLMINGNAILLSEPITTSKLKMIFNGLEKGTEYGFRVRAH